MADHPDDEIVVPFVYCSTDHTRALERVREIRLLQFVCLVPAVLYMGAKAYEMIQGEPRFSDGWMWSLLKNAVMLSGLTLPYWFLRATRTQAASLRQDGAAEAFRFSRDGFSLSADAVLTPWGLMDRVTEVKGAFLLKDSLSNWPVYMPTTSLSPSELERLRNLISAGFSSRPRKLRLLGSRKSLLELAR
jgi:hypothetical protein